MLGFALLMGSVGALAIGVSRLASDGPASDVRLEAPAQDAAVDPSREPAAGPAREEVPVPVPATDTETAPAATAAPPAAAGPEPTASPTPSADSGPSPGPAAPAEPVDAPELLSFQGYLTVESSVDAEVVVQGQPAGRTNQRLLTRCGPRNVRLRDGATWITEGTHVRIVCMKHTSIRVSPAGDR